VSQSTSVAVSRPSAISAFTQPAPGALPATHVEGDAAECGRAKLAHLLGVLGILGTGVYYWVKRKEAGAFARDQMREAFNFHLLVFAVAVVLSIAGSIVARIVGPLAIVFGLASLALWAGAVVLSVMSAFKAGKGRVARYPARISVLK
jgi:uncharacterized Tic20 family protein